MGADVGIMGRGGVGEFVGNFFVTGFFMVGCGLRSVGPTL